MVNEVSKAGLRETKHAAGQLEETRTAPVQDKSSTAAAPRNPLILIIKINNNSHNNDNVIIAELRNSLTCLRTREQWHSGVAKCDDEHPEEEEKKSITH